MTKLTKPLLVLAFAERGEDMTDAELAEAIEASLDTYGTVGSALAREAARRFRGLPRKPGPKRASKRKDRGRLTTEERYCQLFFTYVGELGRAERERAESDHAPRAVKTVARERAAAIHGTSVRSVERAIKWVRDHTSDADT